LIKDFIIADGLTPGKKMVVVILDVDDPQSYSVSVGGTILEYSDAVGGFRGEVDEADAVRSKVVVTP